tara:strand:+ start:2986 stop:3789 length:804 start_codon:yes stop_codon:yes gene_type:complete
LDKKFSFSKDIATTIGLECAVIYEFLKNKKTDYISISELNDELNFWPNQKIIEYVAELDQKGLISFDLKRGRLSIKNKISKTKLQTPKSFDKSEMGVNWLPSDDVVEILLKAEIGEDFIHNLIPEFRVYWMEKPGIHVSYNSKFIEYARFKWAQYTAEVDTRTKPFVIDDSWQPSDECREVLSLSGISEDFANEKILDFILYWKQDGRAFNTWDVKFLNHVKTCWNKEVEKIKKEPKINIDFYEAEEKPKSKKSNLNLKKYRKKYNI